MISKQASILPRRLIRRYHTNDPFEIAAALDITVMERSDFQRQKGAFKVVLHNSFIFINATMSNEMKRIVCAHELGHALLHRSLGKTQECLMEFELFNITNSTEYEANLFAANLLLDDQSIDSGSRQTVRGRAEGQRGQCESVKGSGTIKKSYV